MWIANNINGGTNANVIKLSSNDTLLGTFPVASYFLHGIAIDSSGNAWVTDSQHNNVIELGVSGTTIGTYSVGSAPIGIAIDASGNVWVANANSNNVTELVGVAKGPQYFPYTGPQFPGGGNGGNY